MMAGQPANRVEGPAKVSGRAKYAADQRLPDMLYGAIVGAPVAAGRIVRIDASATLALPGVVRVLTAADMPRFGKVEPPASVTALPMQDDRIRHEGEPVAIVLAETIEAADAGRAAVRVEVEAATPLVIGRGRREAAPNTAVPLGGDGNKGDVASGLAAATTRLEAVYVQPERHHNPMETSGTLAQWEGDRLTLWDSVQAVANPPLVLSAAFGIPAEDIRVICPHTGGGYGCKGYVWPHQVLAAAAAKVANRPVRLHLSRADHYVGAGYQPWMRQEVALGVDAQGRLTALRQHVTNSTAVEDIHVEPASEAGKTVYASPAIETRQALERVNANLPTALRAPVEGPGLWAIESALNELAHRIGMDPLDIRLANHADTDPHTGKAWSSKKLREAYEEGARLYGWRERASRPKTHGPWRIGHGMATCCMGAFRFPGSAKVRLRADGKAEIEAATGDIGTGTQTVFSQIAAEELGLPLEAVSILWGDTRLHRTGPVYGSSATIGTGSAVALACRDIKAKLAGRSILSALEALRASGQSEIEGQGDFALPGDAPFEADGAGAPVAMKTWGAIFLEVGVDPDLGLVRLRRAVGAYSAGRIVNPKTARSQMTGGIIWGWGKATMERSIQEPTYGRWLAKNLSNVAIPVNADIPSDLQIHFVDEYDEHASAIGARGIGELGATGVDAAVADAVFDAVGVRFRELPITPPRILAALSAA
jgi:xanthine dehydrogenase YagR molybdenum-binding subunit